MSVGPSRRHEGCIPNIAAPSTNHAKTCTCINYRDAGTESVSSFIEMMFICIKVIELYNVWDDFHYSGLETSDVAFLAEPSMAFHNAALVSENGPE